MVSQQHERIETRQKNEMGDMSKRGVETDQDRCENDATASQYSSPKSTVQVTAIRKVGVPVKPQEQNSWADLIWHVWTRYQQSLPPANNDDNEEENEDFTEITVTAMNF